MHFRCADNILVVFLLVLRDEKPWRATVGWLDRNGMAADLTQPQYNDFAYRQMQFSHIQGILEAFFR
jgi:hypothetical protein